MEMKMGWLERMRRGFTLIELLVVISIIALLIGILLPALAAAREQAVRTQCMTNQRQITTAVITYSVDHDGEVPKNYGNHAVNNAPHNGFPWRWSSLYLVKPLSRYTIDDRVVSCPSTGSNVPGTTADIDGDGEREWSSRILYLPGLGDKINGQKNVADSSWLETKRSAASQVRFLDQVDGVVTADRNIFLGAAAGTPDSNHGVSNSGTTSVSFDYFLNELPGSNRLFVDGHGEWAPVDLIGKDGERPETSADGRYQHGPNRPYFW
ncbi:type II secretion system protein [Poriferisphaera sp. WC338]|uniref:type II secretion system protein n=1 Tax=Poriferisphaera sp. WC338 TaxID=3425129 RepID=UPI003D81AE43